MPSGHVLTSEPGLVAPIHLLVRAARQGERTQQMALVSLARWPTHVRVEESEWALYRQSQRVRRRHTSSASESKNTTAETDRRTSARRHSRAADDTAAVTDH